VGALAEAGSEKVVQSRTFEAGTLLETNDDGNCGVFQPHDIIENRRLTWITRKKLVYTYENARHSVGVATRRFHRGHNVIENKALISIMA
jgi:hypothetical protein